MTRLSTQSILFLKELRKQGPEMMDSDQWKMKYTGMFCELYEIISDSSDVLNQFSVGRWSIHYEGQDDLSQFTFTYSLKVGEKDGPKIILNIHPFSQSTIEVDPGTMHFDQSKSSLEEFYSSPAYRRYFANFAEETQGLKTYISNRQLSARHFGGYLNHLFNMMEPYLKFISRSHSKSLAA